MAQKVITTLVDDIDGVVIEDGKGETVNFALDGTTYEIDLTEDNARKLRDALQPFVESGRKANRGTTAASRGISASSRKNSKEELSAAREWLKKEGHQVSDRGRVPASLLELYRSQSR